MTNPTATTPPRVPPVVPQNLTVGHTPGHIPNHSRLHYTSPGVPALEPKRAALNSLRCRSALSCFHDQMVHPPRHRANGPCDSTQVRFDRFQDIARLYRAVGLCEHRREQSERRSPTAGWSHRSRLPPVTARVFRGAPDGRASLRSRLACLDVGETPRVARCKLVLVR